MIQRALKLTELFPPKIKGPYSKRLKLQLVGLPVRNLHGFNMDETELKVRFGAPGSNSLNDDTTLRHQLNSTTSIPNLNSLSVLNQNAPLDVRPTEKPESILQGLLRKRNKWGRWHPIYCVLHNTSFRYSPFPLFLSLFVLLPLPLPPRLPFYLTEKLICLL